MSECGNCSGRGIIFGPIDEETGDRMTRLCHHCGGFGIFPRRARNREAYLNTERVAYRRLPA